MKNHMFLSLFLITLCSSAFAQDFIQGQPGSAEPAAGERVTANSVRNVQERNKTSVEIESEVVRYLAVQLTNDTVSDDLKAFLGLDEQQVGEILSIIKPIEDHFLDLELERMQAMCEAWTRSENRSNNAENLDQSLNAYSEKLAQQRAEPMGIYQAALRRIGNVIGAANADAWNEYLIIQRERMARATTTYFHENAGLASSSIASVQSICGGQ